MRDARGLVILFALAVLAPAVILTVLGFRSLDGERKRAAADARERLQEAVSAKAGEIDAGLDRLRSLLDLPLVEAAQSALEGSVVLYVGDGAAPWAPSAALAYSGLAASARTSAPQILAAAQDLEIRQGKPDEALKIYRKSLGAAGGSVRVWRSLHLAARSQRKLGRMDEAVRYWNQMLREPEIVLGGLPSHLVAGAEAAAESKDGKLAAALLNDLVRGRWRPIPSIG